MENPIHFLDFNNRAHLFALLEKLRAEDQAAFGMMTPQHMVEHLAWVTGFSNGLYPQQAHYSPEKMAAIKKHVIYTNNEITPFKAPVMPLDELVPLQCKSLPEAIAQLRESLDRFDQYFTENPQSKPVSPVLGEMDHAEWIVFHGKHFTHHYKQFGLL